VSEGPKRVLDVVMTYGADTLVSQSDKADSCSAAPRRHNTYGQRGTLADGRDSGSGG